MTTAPNPFAVIQARARLRKELPVLPKDEYGDYPFNHYMLEGYLFGIHLAPYKLDSDEWGEELESLLPETCEVTDELINDCLCLYDDML